MCPLVSAGHKLWPATKSLQCPVSELSTAVLGLTATPHSVQASAVHYLLSQASTCSSNFQTFILQLQTTITQ